MRLFELGGMLHTEMMPVPRTDMGCLDDARLMNYIKDILRDPDVPQSSEAWQARLLSLGFLTEAADHICCTIAGLLLFGKARAVISNKPVKKVMAFNKDDKVYQAVLDEIIDGPLVGRWDMDNGDKRLIDGGIIERFMKAMTPFISQESGNVNEELGRRHSTST